MGPLLGADLGTPSHLKSRILNIFQFCKKQSARRTKLFLFFQAFGDSYANPISGKGFGEKMTRLLSHIMTMLADGAFNGKIAFNSSQERNNVFLQDVQP